MLPRASDAAATCPAGKSLPGLSPVRSDRPLVAGDRALSAEARYPLLAFAAEVRHPLLTFAAEAGCRPVLLEPTVLAERTGLPLLWVRLALD